MEITYTNKVIKMTGDEILEREERWRSWNHSRISLWDTLTQEHYEHGHDADDIDDCEECNAQVDNESVERRCDDKTLREIMGDVSLKQHSAFLKMFRAKIKSMELTIEMEV
jgi:hypothetical protein